MTIQLGPGRLRAMRRNSQIIRVISGHAWITFNGKDMYLESDQETVLVPGSHHAVISALGDQQLIYEIEESTDAWAHQWFRQLKSE